jgi:hypothetical protein
MNNSIFSKFFSRARTTDPITSYEAADAITNQMLARHFHSIVDVLKHYGPMGKDGIAAHCGLDGNQVARRLPELLKKDLVYLTGNTVESLSGRKEREWGAK